jgi:hypothetical protein
MKSPGGDAVKAPRGASSERPRRPNLPPGIPLGVVEADCLRYNRTAMANSRARIAAAIASGQNLSFGVLFTGLYCRTLKPVPGRPALTYRCPRAVTPAWKPRPANRDADAGKAHVKMHAWQHAEASLKP